MRGVRLAMVLGVVMSVFALLSTLFVNVQMAGTPQITVSDQLVLDGYVTIDSIYSESAGFVVIQRASDGGVVGVSQPLAAGWTNNLRIDLNTRLAETRMSAMLYVDDNTTGTYEYSIVEGADLPVRYDNQIVNTPFKVQVLDATDQKIVDGSVTIRSVAMPADGWVVVHSGNKDTVGEVLGQTLVKAGTTTDVSVALTGDLTSMLWSMLYVDNASDIDRPVVVNGSAASAPIWTVNHLRVNDQATIYGSNMPTIANVDKSMVMVHIDSALSDEPGIVVIYADDNGKAGAILGAAYIRKGLTENIHVMLDESADIPPILWTILHVDAGIVGKYEGADVDPIAFVDGEAVIFAINTAPSLTVAGQEAADDGTITIQKAMTITP